MDKKLISGVVITLVVAGTLGFYGGMKYQQSRVGVKGFANLQNLNQEQRQQMFGQVRQNGQAGITTRRQGMGGEFINGEILSKDDKSLTVKLRDGGSKIVFYSDKTAIGKTTDGTIADLENGKTVMISASANPDGSVTAQNIQIRPAMPAVPAPQQ